jgi:hypothetical protein
MTSAEQVRLSRYTKYPTPYYRHSNSSTSVQWISSQWVCALCDLQHGCMYSCFYDFRTHTNPFTKREPGSHMKQLARPVICAGVMLLNYDNVITKQKLADGEGWEDFVVGTKFGEAAWVDMKFTTVDKKDCAFDGAVAYNNI